MINILIEYKGDGGGEKRNIIEASAGNRHEPQRICGIFRDPVQNSAGMGTGTSGNAGIFAAIDVLS